VIDEDTWLLNQAWMLASRLEKLSADSIWARRSSGVRGNLLRELEFARAARNSELNKTQREHLLSLLEIGFDYLERGAREKLGV
jgi:hypothetical protein